MASLLEVSSGNVRPELLLAPAALVLPEVSEIDEPEPPFKRASMVVSSDGDMTPLHSADEDSLFSWSGLLNSGPRLRKPRGSRRVGRGSAFERAKKVLSSGSWLDVPFVLPSPPESEKAGENATAPPQPAPVVVFAAPAPVPRDRGKKAKVLRLPKNPDFTTSDSRYRSEQRVKLYRHL